MRNRFRCLALLAFAVPALAQLEEQGPKQSAPSGLLAGVARADITPPSGIAHLNWGSQTHVEAIGSEASGLIATVLVLSDGKQKFVMADLDAVLAEDFEAAIPEAAARSGIPAAHIRIGVSHTHAGPGLRVEKGPPGLDMAFHKRMFENYRRTVQDKIIGAIVEAGSRLEPAHIYGRKGTGSININRRFRAAGGNPPAVGRNPEGFLDRDLLVLRIDDAVGKPIAVLVNYQCHGTVMGYANRFISSDWIGPMRRTVEQSLPGSKCLFFQGAAGNQGPIEGFTGDLGVATRLGSILGHEAAALALRTETVRREPLFEGYVESTAYQAKQYWRVAGPRPSQLRLVRKTIDVPRRRYSPEDIKEAQASVEEATRQLQAANASGDKWKIYQLEARLRRFSDLLKMRKTPLDPSPRQIALQVLRIGDIAVFSMPGEPFAEIGAAIKKASPFAITLFCGYSSGRGGDYIPVAEEYVHGGYEVGRTPYDPGTDRRIIEEGIKLLKEAK
ncbi:MAG TPA: neutral/alkaline non-lysosomal ceramidase N-terminal domain-containing protein [Bryobacteraceae bacterium]|nr:neutral/alkaline non-lysosomal ceramidase N-terminal domain-containing protein [Bryobacteraceae bacterium]